MQTMDMSDYDVSMQVYPLDIQWGMLIIGEAMHVWGSGYIGNLGAFPQLYCEPKIAPKN